MTSSSRMRIADKLQKGHLMISVLIVALSVSLTWFAINYQNKNATNGYQMKKLQERRSELIFQIETLEMEIADLGSLSKKQ